MAELWTTEIRKKLATVADILAVAIVVSLPWSTSATGILVGLWFFTLVPVLRWDELRREILTPAGGLPVLLVLLGVAGMLWADVALLERWKGLDSFLKLLAIPLLLVQFRRSEHGSWVFAGYLLSCVTLLVVTAIVIAIPPLAATFLHFVDNVIVKNAATQSGEFVTCIFGLLYLMTEAAERRSWTKFFVFSAIIVGMLASILYLATGRTALVVALALLIVFAVKTSGARGAAIVFSGAMLVGVVGWTSSPYLRERTTQIWSDLKQYEVAETLTPSGERACVLEEVARVHFTGTGDRARYGNDPFALREIRCGADRGCRRNLGQSAQPDLRCRNSARPRRHRRALGDVDRASAAFSRRAALPRGLALLWSCRTLSVRYSTRTSSISRKGGPTSSGWGWRGEWQ